MRGRFRHHACRTEDSPTRSPTAPVSGLATGDHVFVTVASESRRGRFRKSTRGRKGDGEAAPWIESPQRWHQWVTTALAARFARPAYRAVGQDNAGHALQEDAVVVRNLLRPPHEHTTRSSTTCASVPHAIRPTIASCNGCRYRDTSSFRITSSTVNPFSPIRMGMDQLTHEVDLLGR